MDRLLAITRCMNELAKCRKDMAINPTGACVGQLDWLCELHILLHI